MKMPELFTKAANGSSPAPTTIDGVVSLIYWSHALPSLGLLGHRAHNVAHNAPLAPSSPHSGIGQCPHGNAPEASCQEDQQVGI